MYYQLGGKTTQKNIDMLKFILEKYKLKNYIIYPIKAAYKKYYEYMQFNRDLLNKKVEKRYFGFTLNFSGKRKKYYGHKVLMYLTKTQIKNIKKAKKDKIN